MSVMRLKLIFPYMNWEMGGLGFLSPSSCCPPAEVVAMARITHLRDALIPLVLFISIFVVSVVDASDVVDAEFGLEFSEAGPLSQNTSSSFDMTDLGFPHLLQKRACPVGSSLCISKSSLFVLRFS